MQFMTKFFLNYRTRFLTLLIPFEPGGINPLPPGDFYLVTNDGIQLTTNDGHKLITT